MPIQLSDVPRFLLLLIIPIVFSWLAAWIESTYQTDKPNTLVYVSFVIAIMMTLTSRLAIPGLKRRQLVTLFFTSLLTPFLAILIVIIIPEKLYSLNPVSHGYYRLVTDVAAMSLTYWATMSCAIILTFRPRLPLSIIAVVMASALVFPPISMLLVLEGDDLNDYARQVAFFSIFCTPTIPLGCILTIYAPLILNQQTPTESPRTPVSSPL